MVSFEIYQRFKGHFLNELRVYRKQTWSFHLQVFLSTYDLLLPLDSALPQNVLIALLLCVNVD